MKNIKTIAAIFSLMLIYSIASAQGNCPGDNIKVFRGATGCGCKCLKECVTPEELPDYLADGWNTVGCWNCCKFKNWVEGDIRKTSLDEVKPNAEAGSLTVAFTLAEESDVKIQVTDMAGRYVATVVDEHREDHDNELVWDASGLSAGMYILNMQAGCYSENKIVSVVN